MAVRKTSAWAASIQWHNRPIITLLFVQLMSGTVLSPLGIFFPVYLDERLGYTAVFVSASVAIGRLFGMIAAVAGGALSDSLGRKWTLVLGLVGIGIGCLLFLVRAPWIVIALWAISGLGLGLHSLGAQSYLIDAAGSGHLGVTSALFHWGYTLGGVVSSPAAGAILDSRGFDAFGLALFTVALATLLVATTLLPRLPCSSDSKPSSWAGSLFGYREVLRRPAVDLLGLMRFLPTCYYGMASMLNPLLINRMTGSKSAVALYGTTSMILATLGQILVGRAADRLGHRTPTLVTYSVLLTSIIGQAVFGHFVWSFYVFGALGICAAWSLSTLMPLLVADAAPVEERGRVLGTLDLLWNVGMMAGALVGGALVEIAVGLPFLTVAVLNVGAIALAIAFFRMITLEESRVV